VSAVDSFHRLDSARVLAVGGLLLAAFGMVVGEIYAIYISHVLNGIIGNNWVTVIEAAGRGDVQQLRESFSVIEDLAAKRGRTMHSHSHLAAYGLLALVLALIQARVDLGAPSRLYIAVAYLSGAMLQVLGNYVSYYAGDAFFLMSDAGALLLILAIAATLWGVRNILSDTPPDRVRLTSFLRPSASRYLVKSGLLLVVLGMIFGLYYAWQLVSVDEPGVYAAVEGAASRLADADSAEASDEIRQFKRMQSRIAITAAAHSHAIEFGFLMLLLAFVQRFIMLSEVWRLRWARTVSVGAFALPVCVYLATMYGLRAAAFSDLFGGIVLLGLSAMIFGMIRHTGAVDAGPDGKGSS
jgi:hypothetical protein